MNEEKNGVADGFFNESKESSFIKGVDFDGDGLTVEVVGMSKFTPSDPKFGVKNTYGAGGVVTKEHWFVANNILAEGESFKYTFLVDGVEKSFDNSSLSFYFAFVKVNPNAGDKLLIKRTKHSETKVEWDIQEVK